MTYEELQDDREERVVKHARELLERRAPGMEVRSIRSHDPDGLNTVRNALGGMSNEVADAIREARLDGDLLEIGRLVDAQFHTFAREDLEDMAEKWRDAA